MSETLIFVIIEALFILICVLAHKAVIKEWGENHNKINIALVVYIASYELTALYRIISIVQPEFNIVFGEALTIIHILSMISLCLQLGFLFYIKKQRKLYSSPIIIAFYIGAGLMIVDSALIFIVYAASSAIITFIFLIQEGKKNNNGLAIGLGVFIIIFGMSSMIKVLILQAIVQLISVVILLAGTSRFIDKFMLLDKEKELKISNVWISRMVIKKEG